MGGLSTQHSALQALVFSAVCKSPPQPQPWPGWRRATEAQQCAVRHSGLGAAFSSSQALAVDPDPLSHFTTSHLLHSFQNSFLFSFLFFLFLSFFFEFLETGPFLIFVYFHLKKKKSSRVVVCESVRACLRAHMCMGHNMSRKNCVALAPSIHPYAVGLWITDSGCQAYSGAIFVCRDISAAQGFNFTVVGVLSMSAYCVHAVPAEARRGHRIPRNWGYTHRQLGTVRKVLGMQAWASGRAASECSCWVNLL